jgi:hypothetical protein
MNAKKAVHKHEANMHPGKTPTKFAQGGKTNMQMRDLGRGLAKVANQKKSVRSVPKTGI